MAATPAPASEPVDLLNPQAVWEAYSGTVLGWSVNVLAAAAILIGGLWLSGKIRKFIRRRIENNVRFDKTFSIFLANLAYYVMIAFILIAVLNRFGVQTTSLVAVLGAATLAIGLALQGTLGNVAAGVMLVLFRPYKIGDAVEVGGLAGTVKDIDIFTTELATVDNVQIIVPNGLCWGQPIRNYSANPLRRLDLNFSISYAADLDAAIEVVQGVVRNDPRVLPSPAAPWVRVVTLGPTAVEVQLQAWVASRDWLDTRVATLKAVKEGLDAAGVEIPYPRFAPLPLPPQKPPG